MICRLARFLPRGHFRGFAPKGPHCYALPAAPLRNTKHTKITKMLRISLVRLVFLVLKIRGPSHNVARSLRILNLRDLTEDAKRYPSSLLFGAPPQPLGHTP